jgi:hypothetical protein
VADTLVRSVLKANPVTFEGTTTLRTAGPFLAHNTGDHHLQLWVSSLATVTLAMTPT